MRLYGHYVWMHVKSQMQHRMSFLLLSMGQFLATFTGFLGMYYMMTRFYQVDGFDIGEVLLCFGITSFSYALAEMVARGFDSFATIIANGEFDRMLVRPRGLIFQVLASRIELSRIGRLIQATLVIIYAVNQQQIEWSAEKIVTFVNMILGGMVLFSALFLLYASLCFFTLEGLEFINIFTDGGREFGQYPYVIYGEKVLKFLTFVVPLALVQYYPLRFLVGQSSDSRLMWVPLLGGLFVIPTYLLWRIGLRRYQSTGS